MPELIPTHPLIETDRLVLRPMVEADAERLHPVFSDAATMRFVDCPRSRSIGDTLHRIRLATFVIPEWHAAWTLSLKRDDAAIGMINYHHRESWNRRLELGYLLASRYWRQGLMSEALDAVLAFCFETLHMHRIEALIYTRNVSAARFAERLGFRLEGGPFRDRIFADGAFRDLMMYALLHEEWLAARCAAAQGAAA